jgi:hypothetical protein
MDKQHAEPKITITAEGILKAVELGATSPTGVAKSLGYKSGSTSIIKRIVAAVPDLKQRLALNAAKADAVAKPAGKQEVAIPDCVPFRRSSGYAVAWSILFAHRERGISKTDLIARYKEATGKPDANCGFDVHVVTSSREDGSSHKSAAKAAQVYFVERAGDLLKMHLVSDAKK